MKLKNIEVENINKKDYPDFSDAYISYAEYENGVPLSDDELALLNDEHPDLVYECVLKELF